jgi:predicted site-specific integrase-resolvase
VATFSEKFRSVMVSKMLGPNPVSASSLAQRAGVTQSTLLRWIREGKMAAVSRGWQTQTETPARRARQWTAAEKLRVVSWEGVSTDSHAYRQRRAREGREG